MCIDLEGWCRRNHVLFVGSTATGIDANRRVVYTEDANELPCDIAVFNLGATNPLRNKADGAVLTKPLRYVERLETWVADVLKRPQPRRSLVVVGGGPAGTEVMLNVSARVRRSARPDALRLTLVYPGERLMPQFSPGRGGRAAYTFARAAKLHASKGIASCSMTASAWSKTSSFGRLVLPDNPSSVRQGCR